MSVAAAHEVAPEAPPTIILVRAAPGVGGNELLQHLRDISEDEDDLTAYVPTRPLDLENIQRVDSMPFVIGTATAAVAIATVAHGLVTSVRRRRRDLAILKTLGFGRRQVRSVVFWQATSVAVLAITAGIPLGIAAGRLAWSLFAEQVGVVPDYAVSALALLVLVPAVLVLANAAAAVPGRIAARVRPAAVLRSE